MRPRLGFLGVGWIGRNRMEAIATQTNAQIVGYADPDADCRAGARTIAPSARACEHLGQLLELGLDGLVIATPSALHAEQSLVALKRGLASMDEHAVAQLGFERVLIVRSAQKPGAATGGHPLARLATLVLSIGKYMIPSSEQPVRAVKVARFVVDALELAPPGIHVAAPETVWQAAQGDVRAAVAQWLAS